MERPMKKCCRCHVTLNSVSTNVPKGERGGGCTAGTIRRNGVGFDPNT